MLDFIKPSYWFNKSASALAGEKVRAEQMARFNAILGCDPDRIASAVTSFSCGYLGGMARIIEEFERRDDKMATCSMKMKASVGRCDYQVLVKEGFEKDPRAQIHVDILKRFWSTVRVTDRFRMNEAGGVRLLKKQMMDAQSYGFAVHEIVWTPAANGEIRAEFIKMPLWHFENKTGSLRFLRDVNDSEGVDMTPGEWLVTTGEGIGIAASIVAMAKHLSFQDWLLFSERSGMPIIIGKTGASFGSDQWNRLKGLIASIYRDTRALVDSSTSIEAIQTGNATNLPFPALVEWADRAIASLYRGADLSTISKGDGTGASLQGDESGMLEQDAVANLGEALHEQVDKFVIRYVTGDDEPLAYISIEPVQKEDVDTDIKIDNHLANLGVKLSKRDALQRYGRVEAEEEDDALVPKSPQPQPGMQGAFGGFANEFKFHPKEPQASGSDADVLNAFAKDSGPAAEAIRDLLQNPTPERAAALAEKIDTLLPEDPALAAVIAKAMAKQFSIDGRAGAPRRPSECLENAITNPCPKCHHQMTKEGTCTHCEKLAANKAAVDGLIADLGKKGKDGKGKGWKDRTEDLGVLEQKTIDDIKKANPNMDVETSVATVNTEQLQHAMRNHGNAEKEAKRGQIAITEDDLSRIPEVLDSYDSIEAGKGIGEGKNQEAVIFKKSYPDGTIACVELDVYNDSLKKRTLKFQTMWKEKK